MLLHAGCGNSNLPPWFMGQDEVRLDLDPACNPDVVADLCQLGQIGPFDTIYCSHVLEHLPRHKTVAALQEFRRVLNDGGLAMVIVPDIEDVKPTTEVLYESPGGSICGLDMMYGYLPDVAHSEHMQHRNAFTQHTLRAAFEEAGFTKLEVRRLENYNLICAAIK